MIKKTEESRSRGSGVGGQVLFLAFLTDPKRRIGYAPCDLKRVIIE